MAVPDPIVPVGWTSMLLTVWLVPVAVTVWVAGVHVCGPPALQLMCTVLPAGRAVKLMVIVKLPDSVLLPPMVRDAAGQEAVDADVVHGVVVPLKNVIEAAVSVALVDPLMLSLTETVRRNAP